VVQLALQRGWFVEVWSWRSALSRALLRMAEQNPKRMRVFHIDSYQSHILYRK
jgi:hypothetical protein